jgi:predicted nucleic acid-binding protein
MRRKRYIFYDVLTFIPLLTALHLINDSESGPGYTENILRFAHDYYLSSYQAAYLELADRKKAILCTLDETLQSAAEMHGVKVLK